MKACVIVFPGSNCDQDARGALTVAGADVRMLWHRDRDIPAGTDLILLPGGFSYGDYLRCGAMAAHSPIIEAVKRFAQSGGLVLGICNGFQILVESRLLPGALLCNKNLRFICNPCRLRVERTNTPFTNAFSKDQEVQFPIAHHEGLYFLPPDELAALEARGGVVMRYLENPNGSLGDIAAVINETGNVLGMMPHPERASEKEIGGDDGMSVWRSLFAHLKERG